jgi:hypothetical protein
MTGDGQLMAVGVNITGSIFDNAVPKELFATSASPGTPGQSEYAVSNDGQRFLVLDSVNHRPTPITVKTNWTSLLK